MKDMVKLKKLSKNVKLGNVIRPSVTNLGNFIVIGYASVGPLCLWTHRIYKFVFQNIVGSSSAKALGWFEKGLEAHIGNFPCFADMLRNADFRRKSTSEIIQKIDTILSFQSRRTFKCQIIFIKGFFLWADDLDLEAGLHSWLMAMEESTDLNINVRFSYTAATIKQQQIDFTFSS